MINKYSLFLFYTIHKLNSKNIYLVFVLLSNLNIIYNLKVKKIIKTHFLIEIYISGEY